MEKINLEFPIDKIEFIFETHGKGNVEVILNDREPLDNFVATSELLAKDNTFKVKFSKPDPADAKSYSVLSKLLINGFDFTDRIKHVQYRIDAVHKHTESSIPNNLYFGYVGEMSLCIEQKNDLLTKAAFIIADQEFEKIKWPMVQGPHYRQKTLENVERDTKYMFTGSLAPRTREIIDIIDNYKISDGKLPLVFDDLRKHVESWINASSRVSLKNFDSLKHFNYSNGIIPCLDSFAQRSKNLYMPEKAYYFYKYYSRYRDKLKNLFEDEVDADSFVLLEVPTLYYDNKIILDKIKEAKEKGCKVALDLTWLPITNGNIEIDLSLVDEIYFSMNKTWPVDDIRPAFRWSKEKIEDASSFETEICIYPKMPPNLFVHLTKKFSFDYIHDKYQEGADKIMHKFDLSPSPVLWFTKHELVKRNDTPIFPGYYMDEFVCLRKLLEFQGKYFW